MESCDSSQIRSDKVFVLQANADKNHTIIYVCISVTVQFIKLYSVIQAVMVTRASACMEKQARNS